PLPSSTIVGSSRSSPARSRPMSRATSASSRLTRWARPAERKPGANSRPRVAPPGSFAASSTRTLRPPLARRVAAARPLWPAPITMASNDVMGFAHLFGGTLQVAQNLGGGVAAGRAHHPAARMGGGAAHVEAGYRAAVLGVAGHRPVEEQLVEGELALEDVALRQ